MAQSSEAGSARAMEIWLLPFAAMFTQPSWLNAVALATGALLCLNRRTVCAALRAVDGTSDKGFSRFHRLLSRGAWSGLTGSRILLGLLLKAFVPDGQPLVIGVDDTIERRRGSKIRDKGIYRDPVRSSRGFFVKVEGLRWLSLQVLARPGFATRTWGLPFLTVLETALSLAWSFSARCVAMPCAWLAAGWTRGSSIHRQRARQDRRGGRALSAPVS